MIHVKVEGGHDGPQGAVLAPHKGHTATLSISEVTKQNGQQKQDPASYVLEWLPVRGKGNHHLHPLRNFYIPMLDQSAVA